MPGKMALLLEINTVLVCLASAYVAVGQDVNPANGIVTTPQQTMTPISTTTRNIMHLMTELENTTSSATITSVQTSVTDTTSSVVAQSRDTTSLVVGKSKDRTTSVMGKSTDTTSSVVGKSRDTTSSVVAQSTDTTSSVVGKSRDTTSSVVGKSTDTTSSVVAMSTDTTSSVVGKSVTTFQIASTETTSPVTTTKSQTVLCYDCNSGNHLKGGVKNSLCSEAGTISAVIYSPTSCKKPCFSRVDRFPAGSVYRGCSEGLYLPGGIPDTDSCYEDPATRNYLCFCSEDRCNTHNLSQISMAYIEQHYAQTTQKTV